MHCDLLEYLPQHELVVEFEIRSIDPESEGASAKLYARVKAEQTDPSLVPEHTHNIRNPRAELQTVDDKISSLSLFVNSALGEEVRNDTKMKRVNALCEHLIGRLQRLQNDHDVMIPQSLSLIGTIRQLEALAAPMGGASGGEYDLPVQNNNLGSGNGARRRTTSPWGGAPGNDLGSWTPLRPIGSGVPSPSARGPGINSLSGTNASGEGGSGRPGSGGFPPNGNGGNGRPNNNNDNQNSRRTANNERNAIYNWRLNFDGDPNKLPVEEFVFRLERLARAEDIDLNRLPELIHILLKGKAETWFWLFTRKQPDASWNGLKRNLQREFATQATDFEIRKQIEARRQRPGECFSDFRLEVDSLNARMQHPLPESELVATLRMNMSRRLKDFLMHREARTVDDLRDLVRPYEKLWAEDDRIRARRGIHEIFDDVHDNIEYGEYAEYSNDPDICAMNQSGQRPPNYTVVKSYQGNQNYSRTNVPSQNYPTNNSMNESGHDRAVGSNQQPVWSGWPQNIPCWNCGKLGHWHLRCREPQNRLYCHGCGTENVPQSKCMRCNPNLNHHPGVPKAVPDHPGSSKTNFQK